MFTSFKKIVSSFVQKITSRFHTIFNTSSLDQATIKEIEKILLEADAGTGITSSIIKELEVRHAQGELSGKTAQAILNRQLLSLLIPPPHLEKISVYLLVGINGSGKTTAIGKLSALFQAQGKKVLIVAADTFRAAATEQVASWATTTGADIVKGKEGQDPASLVFQGCQTFLQGNYDILLIDTAGRLQTKTNLMKELEKIKRVIEKTIPTHKIATLLTIDAMLGQNSIEQARLFHESTDVTGIILTKIDGSAKGGVIFAMSATFKLPVIFLSYGEKVGDIKAFEPTSFIESLLD